MDKLLRLEPDEVLKQNYTDLIRKIQWYDEGGYSTLQPPLRSAARKIVKELAWREKQAYKSGFNTRKLDLDD